MVESRTGVKLEFHLWLFESSTVPVVASREVRWNEQLTHNFGTKVSGLTGC